MISPVTRRSRTETGSSLVKLLIWVTVAGVVVLMGYSKFSRNLAGGPTEESQSVQSEVRDDPNRIDPAPYRNHITSLEQRLYRESVGGYDDAGQISNLAMILSIAVRGDGRDRRRQRAYGILFDYAGEVGAQADVGYATADLDDLQSRWESARDAVFLDAPWFSR